MRKTLLCLAAVAGLTANAQTYTPGEPSQLELTPQSTVVTLTWNWESSSEQTSLENFESEQFPPANWELKSSNSEAECTWMPHFFSEDEEFILSHSGKGEAIIMTGYSDEPTPANHQDESLVVKPKADPSTWISGITFILNFSRTAHTASSPTIIMWR